MCYATSILTVTNSEVVTMSKEDRIAIVVSIMYLFIVFILAATGVMTAVV
jgi:hypothetical protein